MARMFFILLGIAVLISSITYLLGQVFPRQKLVKYSPAILCLGAGGYSFYLAKTVHGGFADLANVIMSMMFFTGFVSGVVTSLIIGLVSRNKS